MKRKIIIGLFSLFLLFSSGAVIAAGYLRNTTTQFDRLLNLHQIQDFRTSLIINIQTAQTDLYTVRTPLGNDLEHIINHGANLEQAARKCTTCHHSPEMTKKLQGVYALVADYQNALSQYMTASANAERIERLKFEAAAIGNRLLGTIEEMSAEAERKLQAMTTAAMARILKVQDVLSLTILLSFFFGAMVAVRLTVSITRPVKDLVDATRVISAGNLGHTISDDNSTEFGELARNFNAMSISLRTGYTQLQQEIAERKETAQALKESKERYELAAQGANDGLWDWDLAANRVFYSPRWKSMLGYDEKDIGERPGEWFALVHADDRKQLEEQIAAHIEGHTPCLESRFRIRHKDGTYRWVLSRGLAVRDSPGKAYRMAGSQTDITEQKVAEQQLLHDALHDALTGLPNRALFMDRLQHVIRIARRRKNYLYAVLFLDIDRFKVINDSLGHVTGDRLLLAISQRLTESLRTGDTVARLGGDEFGILLDDIKDADEASIITERIQKKLVLPFSISRKQIFTTASIGIAVSATGYEKPEHLLRDADIAMYQAKARGKACYEIFDSKMYTNILFRLQMETDLRSAVELRSFVVHYQPIIDLMSSSVIGFEALVRWQHPERGLIYPLEFIPLAEETGLIFPISHWVLQNACRWIKALQVRYPSNPPLKLSVNISSKQLSQPDLVRDISDILTETGLAADCLALEITESMIMEKTESAIALMAQLRELGVHIHIDDFGTGYSSLSYLHRFPVNALKIDRSFVDRMSLDDENLEIIRTIITLAHNLDLDVVAEGVERREDLDFLKKLKCRFAQGFLFSQPMEASDVEAWMTTQVLS